MKNLSGTVVSVNVSERKGTVKHPVESVRLQTDHGIVGDSHAANWHRQISLLAEESIEKMRAMGVPDLTAGKFAENITTKGIVLHSLPVGTRLRIGPCLTEVTQIGKKCHHDCEIFQKVGMCIMPTEGIFVKVLSEGEVRPGDEIRVVEQRGAEE